MVHFNADDDSLSSTWDAFTIDSMWISVPESNYIPFKQYHIGNHTEEDVQDIKLSYIDF